MLNGEQRPAELADLPAAPPPADDGALVVDEGEELVPRSRVDELIAVAEKRARDSAFAEARRTFERARDELVARHEAELAKLRAELTVEVAQATRDAVLAAQKGK